MVIEFTWGLYSQFFDPGGRSLDPQNLLKIDRRGKAFDVQVCTILFVTKEYRIDLTSVESQISRKGAYRRQHSEHSFHLSHFVMSCDAQPPPSQKKNRIIATLRSTSANRRNFTKKTLFVFCLQVKWFWLLALKYMWDHHRHETYFEGSKQYLCHQRSQDTTVWIQQSCTTTSVPFALFRYSGLSVIQTQVIRIPGWSGQFGPTVTQ